MPPAPPADDVDVSLTSQPFALAPGSAEGRSYLLVLEGDSAVIHPLPESGEIVLGRAPDVDLRLHDIATSRRHAQFLVTAGEVRVKDLGSRHGLRVNGEPLGGARLLYSGDVLAVGQATLVYHRGARPSPGRALLGPGALRQRLEEEVERALRYQREVSLLCIDLGGAPIDRARVAAALGDKLRLLDVVAHGGGELFVLLPEVTGEALVATAERLSAALQTLGREPRLGGATCPDDGCDVDTLICGALAAMRASRDGVLCTVAETATAIEVGGHKIAFADPAMHRLYDLLQKLAQSELPVLLCGETGSGKELAAAAIHHHSRRAGQPLVSLNCAALPEALAESELFGHVKGAFTGAARDKAGFLEEAHGGTLFLDEVGELSPATQAKLLRVLGTGRIVRLGDVRERPVDVRLIAATNRDLPKEVEAGRFRDDLLYRLSAARVMLPPLRDRPRDVPVLARTFLLEACTRAGRPSMALSGPSMARLCAYRWPGNVRELRNAIEYAVAVADAGEEAIEPWHLREEIGRVPEGDPEAAGLTPTPAEGVVAPPRLRPIHEEIRELERARMGQALAAASGVQTKAAELIGMPLRTFVTKMRQYGLPRGRPPPGEPAG
jgi:two-component system, NtrC family, response regulator AtoC